ncbi:MAG: DUF1624 domain-containing protein [Clostridia bacterium]|nr:DUF1624 domain-containing protein [Clostridia bacterium]MBQ1895858.1 DUF1624 domain-containing protein [Clostridia bacterium]
MSDSSKRIALLDELRGFCVLCMIFYHAFIFMYEQYDIQFGYDAYTFFLPVQPYVSCMFIFICGICCNLSHSNLKRGLKLAVFALALNFVSIIVLPKMGFVGTEIWWGILDFFTVAILSYVLFEKAVVKTPWILGLFITIFLFWIFRYWDTEGMISLWGDLSWRLPDPAFEQKWLFPLGIQSPDFYSADYFPMIPYVFVFYMGAFLGKPVSDGKVPAFAYPVHSKALTWLGKNCFLIYLVELPIIFIVMELITWIASKF